MGIKRLKKIFVITGQEGAGKTHCIKEIARELKKEGFDKYDDLLQTVSGWFLNQNRKDNDMNDDIFGYMSNDFDRIGIISAGDDSNHIKRCISLLMEFQPDIIICAAQDSISKSVGECVEERYASYANDGVDKELLFPKNGGKDMSGKIETMKISEDFLRKYCITKVDNNTGDKLISSIKLSGADVSIKSIVNQIIDEIRCFNISNSEST